MSETKNTSTGGSDKLVRAADAPRIGPRLLPNVSSPSPPTEPTMHALGAPPSALDPIAIRLGEPIPSTRYRVLRWLGEGGMGVVYEAEHVDVGRRFAVKILHERHCREPEALASFRNEARVTGAIGSPNIVQVHDFAELPDGRLMLAMQMLDGQDLGRSIQQPMDPGRVIAILRQCCRALAAAHDAGVVHRDVKPDNIFLINEDGRPDHVKLVDFGVAVVMAAGAAEAVVQGTPAFLAPEAILEASVHPKIDQYALGCVAFAMLTGRAPFLQDSVREMLAAHVQQAPPAPSEVGPCPSEFDAFVLRCMAKSPTQRFDDLRQAEAALCRIQIKLGLSSVWDDLPLPQVDVEERDWLLQRMPEPERQLARDERKKWFIGGASLALVLGVGTTVVLTSSDEPEAQAVVQDVVAVHARAARDAAAAACFVFPPAAQPSKQTAYQIVTGLEALEGSVAAQAKDKATALRREFAATLSRLGDTYWSAAGGKPFAIAYYQQAVLFDPSQRPASQRALLDDNDRSLFAERARLSNFSPLELAAFEPLKVLAEPDATVRDKMIAAIEERTEQQLSSLASLAGASARPKAKRPAPAAPVVQVDAAPPADETETADREIDGNAPPDKRGAAKLSKQGHLAARKGETETARRLFEQALAKHARDKSALRGLRDLFFESSDYGRAAKYGARLVRVAGNTASHRLRLGDAYFKTGRYAEAEVQYQRAADLGEKKANWRLAETRDRLGR